MSSVWTHRYRSIRVRVAVSIVFFIIFTILGVVGVLTKNQDILFWLPILVIGAIFTLPRQTVPRGTTPTDEVDRTMHSRLASIRLWLAYVRAAYFMTAVFILFALPELV